MDINLAHKFGYNCRQYRRKLGLKQKELAYKLRIRGGYVSEVELGKANITIKVVELMAEALGVSPDKLFS